MTKLEQSERIAREMIDTDRALHDGKITPQQWHMMRMAIYRRYDPDVNVWRRACKCYALQTGKQWLPCD